MGKYSKPAEFRVKGKVNLAKSTDVSAGVQSKVNLAKSTDVSAGVQSKVYYSITYVSDGVNSKVPLSKSTDVSAGVQSKVNLEKSTGIDRVCVGFVFFGIAILIVMGWVHLGDWLSTLLGEEKGRDMATLIVGIFIALILILTIGVALKVAWDNFDAGDGTS